MSWSCRSKWLVPANPVNLRPGSLGNLLAAIIARSDLFKKESFDITANTSSKFKGWLLVQRRGSAPLQRPKDWTELVPFSEQAENEVKLSARVKKIGAVRSKSVKKQMRKEKKKKAKAKKKHKKKKKKGESSSSDASSSSEEDGDDEDKADDDHPAASAPAAAAKVSAEQLTKDAQQFADKLRRIVFMQKVTPRAACLPWRNAGNGGLMTLTVRPLSTIAMRLTAWQNVSESRLWNRWTTLVRRSSAGPSMWRDRIGCCSQRGGHGGRGWKGDRRPGYAGCLG
jgi:hypothetical protein